MSPSASRATSQQGAKRHLIAWLSAATLGLTFASSSLLTAPAMAEEVSTAPTAIVLGVGANESQRILSWYTSEDTSHSTLTPAGGRDYASNSFGMQRKDWTQ